MLMPLVEWYGIFLESPNSSQKMVIMMCLEPEEGTNMSFT